MKKIVFVIMMLIPVFGYSASIVCVRKNWPSGYRTVFKERAILYEKEGNVFLSSDVVGNDVDIFVITHENSTFRVTTSVTVNSELVILSQDEIPQEGCYVRITQGDKYVLYFVTRD